MEDTTDNQSQNESIDDEDPQATRINQLIEDSNFEKKNGDTSLFPEEVKLDDIFPSVTKVEPQPVLMTELSDSEIPYRLPSKKKSDIKLEPTGREDEEELQELNREYFSDVEDDDNDLPEGEQFDPEIYQKRANEIEELINNDELWDTDLEEESDPEEAEALHDTTGKYNYKKICERKNVVPVKYFIRHICDPNLSLKYHGLGGEGARAIATALTSNITVEHLDLSGNWLETEGAIAVGKMIEENSFIQTLILSDNRLRGEGMQPIFKAVPINSTITYLDLSGNEIDDAACEGLGKMIENSKILTSLILKHNHIGSEGGEYLGPALAANDFLEYIDLSWNRIRTEGAIAVAKGIRENVRLKEVNISWNGFANDGGKHICDMIRENSTVLQLDIRGNRLDDEVAALLGKALAVNESLTRVNAGNNPIKTSGMIQLISAFAKAPESSPLLHLSLSDIPVEYQFIKILDEIQSKRPDFKCDYGLELRVGTTEEDIKKPAVELKPLTTLLREQLRVNDLRLIHSLQKLDENETHAVTENQLIQVLNELGIPFKKAHIEEAKIKLNKLGDGTIYFGDFIPPSLPERGEVDLLNLI